MLLREYTNTTKYLGSRAERKRVSSKYKKQTFLYTWYISTLVAKKEITYRNSGGISKYGMLIPKCLRLKVTEIHYIQNDGCCGRVLENCVFER